MLLLWTIPTTEDASLHMAVAEQVRPMFKKLLLLHFAQKEKLFY